MDNSFKQILQHMNDHYSYDFRGYSPDMLKRRIRMRFVPTGSRSFGEYYHNLTKDQIEGEQLLQSITIKVSHFFRNPLDFEIVNKIMGDLITKQRTEKLPVRIWSAGCANGEEAYSLAIYIRENLHKYLMEVNIIATDIDNQAILKAKEGIYNQDAVKEVRYGLLNKYFQRTGDEFRLAEEVKKMVDFSIFDLLDHNNSSPPASVFGGFDLVLCRNVLIYYNKEYQEKIFDKLYQSLNKGAYLMLGEAENIAGKYKDKFRQVAPYSKIFKKRELNRSIHGY